MGLLKKAKDMGETTVNLSFHVDMKNISPSSAILIRQRLRGTIENFVRVKRLRDFVEVVEMGVAANV